MQYLDIRSKNTENKIKYLKQDLKAIFFDMDGTIALTTNLELNCFVKLFGKNKNYWKKHFGPPLIKLLHNANPKLNKKTILEMARLWDLCYENKLVKKDFIPYDAKTILKQLKKKYIIGIITSTVRSTTKKTLNNYYDLFDFLLCADEYKKHKPNPFGLKLVMKKYKLKPKNIIYVGDNINDIKFGKNAQVKTIGKIDILYNKKQLEKYNPDLIIKNLCDLKCLI